MVADQARGVCSSVRMAVAVIVLSLCLMACQTVPETEREQLLLTSPDLEKALGDQAFSQVMRSHQEIVEGQDYETLQRVGRRIVSVAQPELAARGFGDLEWSFHLIDDDTANAFVVPSGQVVFFQGIMPILENEAGVAAVMGHEVAHVIARHGGERISQRLLVSSGTLLAASALSDDPDEGERWLGALGLAALFAMEMPYSRTHESEADYLGTRLMAKAGYDPEEAVRVWERMEAATLSLPAFLSSHPTSRSRRDALEADLPVFRELMPDADKQSPVPVKGVGGH
ncbi:putative Zn-dependent protease [Natronospira proteinivora]|uniref:Zn-dependent protease n=1 Tax=Natronospira proteinivora TaxID=1807133 RepID=A0ABT1GDB2_9GAMM|nr:M48 family metallopeptidase [Natronospira proteinivora]MCP1728358.1 putative Zn-dependent protease [Natronospira proteinivora]